MMKRTVTILFICCIAVSSMGISLRRMRTRFRPASQGADWLQLDDKPDVVTEADTLLPRSLGLVTQHWSVTIPDTCDGSPVYVSSIPTVNGIHDFLIMTTMYGGTVALDAFTGQTIWQTTPPKGPRWTTSSPAISPDRRLVYSYGLDGYVHRYRISDGSEIGGEGWPQLVTRKGEVEKVSSSLSIVTTKDHHNYLYVTTAGYPEPGDDGDYQGHLVVIDLDDDSRKVFNAACSDKEMLFVANGDESNDCTHVQSGIWGRAPVAYDPVSDRILITTSNGDYDADRGGYNWGDSIIALRPDGSTDGGTPLDSYTPAEYQTLQDLDLDFGSVSPLILPLAERTRFPRIALQTGKDHVLRLVDIENLSGQGGPRHVGGELSKTPVPQGGIVIARPAAWLAPDGTTWVFVTTYLGASGLAVVSRDGVPQLEPRWTNSLDGATPVVVNGVLYFARNHELVALNPQTGERLWSDDSIGPIHWQSPIVVNGRIYVCDHNRHVYAYAVTPADSRQQTAGSR